MAVSSRTATRRHDAVLQNLQSMDGWMYWIARFGYPPRLALLIGALEFVGGGPLLLPRAASYAALGLGAIMVGALEAVLTTETSLGWKAPLIHLALLATIGAGRWPRRWRPGPAGAQESDPSP